MVLAENGHFLVVKYFPLSGIFLFIFLAFALAKTDIFCYYLFVHSNF
jgi:hypothetical protein